LINTYTNPRVSESLGGRNTPCRVDGQHAVDEVLRFRGDRVPLRRWILTQNTQRGAY